MIDTLMGGRLTAPAKSATAENWKTRYTLRSTMTVTPRTLIFTP